MSTYNTSSNINVIDNEVLSIIKSQTSVQDDEQITNAFKKNNGSISDTIMELMNYNYCDYNRTNIVSQSNTRLFENIRSIVADKENVFYELLNNNKRS